MVYLRAPLFEDNSYHFYQTIPFLRVLLFEDNPYHIYQSMAYIYVYIPQFENNIVYHIHNENQGPSMYSSDGRHSTTCISRLTIRLGFPGHVLFFGPCPGVRAAFQKCPGLVRVLTSSSQANGKFGFFPDFPRSSQIDWPIDTLLLTFLCYKLICSGNQTRAPAIFSSLVR